MKKLIIILLTMFMISGCISNDLTTLSSNKTAAVYDYVFPILKGDIITNQTADVDAIS